MKNIGIIAEYNPLHNGHLYQMSKISKDNNIIVALSGNFTERGDVALMNKYTRARQAILHGASLVIEIPTPGVLSCAELYAKCAVRSLSLLGNIDELSFGSELGDIATLNTIANAEETSEVSNRIKALLDEGMSYPTALSTAISEFVDIPNAVDILSNPNNILGIEYIRACMHTDIIPTTIVREGSGYNETTLMHKYASASSIRENLMSDEVTKYLPQDVLEYARRSHINLDIIYSNLYQKLAVEDTDIENIFGIVEGIDNRIKKALTESSDYASLLEHIKTKRYTLSRIKRTLLDILLGIKNDIANDIESLDYITVLAVRRDRLGLLSSSSANIITKYNDYQKTCHPFSEVDKRSNRLYNLLSNDKITSHGMLIID